MSEVTLYSQEVEQHFLGLLLNYPDLWSEISFAAEKDFSPVRQRVFSVIRQQLELTPPQSVSPVILTEKLKSYGQSTTGEVDTLTYLEGLQRRGRLIEKKEAMDLLKELKKLTVKRELLAKCDEAKVRVAKAETLTEMTEAVTATIASVNTDYFKSGQTEDMFDGMMELIEERGNRQTEELGYVGVLPSIDATVGPLFHRGSFCNISARSGVGKSSIGFFYAVSTVEKYDDMRLLWLDAGEMTIEQLRFRAACCFSQGRVPLWALRSGAWRKNKEWVDIIRGEVGPRVKRLIGRVDYKNVSGLAAKEKVNFMRRHYYNKVGRGNFLAILDDYLKGIESMNKESKEYMTVGYYTSDVKNLVTDEINGGFMTFTQSNRFGISKGKKAEDIVDNDSVISLSDRIKDNCTTNWLMRFKVNEELGREKGAYGNIVLKNLKTREGLGRDFENFVRPIKLSSGQFAEDYFNLDYHGFHYVDKGRYSQMLSNLGHTAVDLTSTANKPVMP